MAGFKALCKLSFHPPGGFCSLEEPSANSGNGASSEGPLSSCDEPAASPLGRPHQEGYLSFPSAGQPVGNKDLSPGNKGVQCTRSPATKQVRC